jgi:hypothetical protein
MSLRLTWQGQHTPACAWHPLCHVRCTCYVSYDRMLRRAAAPRQADVWGLMSKMRALGAPAWGYLSNNRSPSLEDCRCYSSSSSSASPNSSCHSSGWL